MKRYLLLQVLFKISAITVLACLLFASNAWSFSIALPVAPANDASANATTVSHIANWCSGNAVYTTVGAAPDGTKPSNWETGPNSNVWFKFQATTTSVSIAIKTEGAEGTMGRPYVALHNSALTELRSTSNSYNAYSVDMGLSYEGLTIGQWYYINVDNGNEVYMQGTFTLCINTTVTQDYPAGAVVLTDLNNWCSANSAYTTHIGTADGSKPSTWSNGPNNNVWFKFQATTNAITVNVKVGDEEGSLGKPMVALYNNSLTTLHSANEIGYSTDIALSYDELTPGAWYYISVDNGNENYMKGSFKLCVSSATTNDKPAGATTLTNLNNWCSANAAYTTMIGSADGTRPSHWASGPNNNVWFKFQATTSAVAVTLKTGDAEGSLGKGALALYTQTFSELRSVGNISDYYGDIGLSNEGLTVGAWYYISVDNGEYSSERGTFTLCVNDAVSQDYPAGAVVLNNLNEWCSGNAAYTTVIGTPDGTKPSNWLTNPNNNIWFKFQAITHGVSIDVKTGGAEGNLGKPAISLHNSAMTSLQNTSSTTYEVDVNLSYQSLTVGEWYYINIDNGDSNFDRGTFTLCVNALGLSGVLPIAPSDLTGNALPSGPIDLSWVDNSNNETNFKIERWSQETELYEVIAEVSPNVISYTDNTVQKGKYYGYKIQAVNITGSSYSEEFWIETSTSDMVVDETELSVLKNIAENSNGHRLTALGWPAIENWPLSATSLQMNSWGGITVENEDITEIAIEGDYYGYFPDVSALTQLKKLSLDNTLLYGLRATQIFPVLEELRISNNTFSEAIDFQYMPGLNFLGMNRYGGMGTVVITPLKQLQSFEAEGNNFMEFPTGIFSINTLQNIHLANNNITTIPSLGNNIRSLKYLDVRQNLLDFGDLEQFFNGVNTLKFSNLTLLYTDQKNYPSRNIIGGIGKYTIVNDRGQGSYSKYQWLEYVNGNWVLLPGRTSKDLEFDVMNRAFVGRKYICKITNDRITDLILYSSEFTIQSVEKSLTATTNSPTTIQLEWRDLWNDETGFVVERSVVNGVFSTVTTLDPNSTSYSINNAVADFNYVLRIRVKNENDYLDYTNEVSITPASIPLTPAGLTAIGVSTAQINLRWADLPFNEVGFEVLRSSAANGDFVVIGTTETNVNFFEDTDLTTDTRYFYRVRSKNTSGISSYCEGNGSTLTHTSEILHNLAFQYKYDARHRVTHKKIPGADWVYIVYDDRDRVVVTQDGNQRTSGFNYWTFTKYDEFNRPIATGIKDTTAVLAQDQMQAVVNDYYSLITTTKPKRSYGEKFVGKSTIGNVHGYTNNSYPVVTTGSIVDANRYLTVAYYDNYAFKNDWTSTYDYLTDGLSETTITGTYTQRGNGEENNRVLEQVTGEKIKVLDGGVVGGYTWLKSVKYYDDKYRLIQTQSDNYKGGTDKVSNLYDFSGKIIKSKETHVESDLTWKDVVKINVEGNKLISLGSRDSESGAISVQTLGASQNGSIECTVSELDTRRVFGLSDKRSHLGSTGICYGFILQRGGVLFYCERNGGSNGNAIAGLISGGIRPGDKLTIERIGNTINYKRNNVIVKSTSNALASPLFAHVSMDSYGGTLTGLYSSFSTTSKEITRRFIYDHAGRLVETWHQVGDHPEIKISQNKYNELGELVTKKLHSVGNENNFKQHVDYRYNIRGWLTRVNNADLNTDDEGPKDFFGMELGYNNDLGIGAFTPQYNGNISAVNWSANLGLGATYLNEPTQRAYTFKYDPLNRVREANFAIKAGAWSSSAAFNEKIDYDLNGNITSLIRNNAKGVAIDKLSYAYYNGATPSNQLNRVTDISDLTGGFNDNNTSGKDYAYDNSGNLIVDRNKGIKSLTYGTYLNLTEQIDNTTGEKIKYIYDANGTKLAEESYAREATTPTKHMAFMGGFVYENDTLQFIQHEEGKIIIPKQADPDPLPEYQYQVKDHVGNIRLTFTTKEKQEVLKATMEDTGVAEENNPRVQEMKYFGNLFETEIRNVNQWLNHTSHEQGNAAYLDGSPGKIIGPYSLLKVYPGDVVKMEAFGKYEKQDEYSAMPTALALLSLLTPIQSATLAIDGAPTFLPQNLEGLTPFLTSRGSDEEVPGIYLNFILFDKDLKPIDLGYDRIDGGGFDPAHESTVEFATMQLEKVIDRVGYLYVYLSNESEGTRAWLDDLTITYKHSPIVQYEDYYPFGLSMSETAFDRYNDKYKGMVTTDGIGLKDLGFRQYDAALGRFHAVDPLAEMQVDNSTYQYAGNNPVSQIDVLGLEADDDEKIKNDKRPKPDRNKRKQRTHESRGHSRYHPNREQRKANRERAKAERAERKKAKEKKKEENAKDNSGTQGKDDDTKRGDLADDPARKVEKSFAPSLLVDEDKDLSNLLNPVYKSDDIDHQRNQSRNDGFVRRSPRYSNSYSIEDKEQDQDQNIDDRDKTKQQLLRTHPVNEARALLQNIIIKDNSPRSNSLKQKVSVLASTSANKEPVDNNAYDFKLLVDNISKANKDNGTFAYDRTNYNYPAKGETPSIYSFDEGGKERYAENFIAMSSGNMDTENPVVSVTEDFLIRVEFKDKDNGNTLVDIEFEDTSNFKAFLRKIGLDEDAFDDAIIPVVIAEIKEEITNPNPDHDKLAALINMLEAEDLKGKISNDEKIEALEILVTAPELFDGDEEQAVITLIAGTSDGEIKDLHEKLNTVVVDGKKLLTTLINRQSDSNPYLSDENYATLVKIFSEQFLKKVSLILNYKPGNSTTEPIEFSNWKGRIEPTGQFTRNKYSSYINETGGISISRQQQQFDYDIASGVGSWHDVQGQYERISYDNALEDAVYVDPEPGSKLHDITGGHPIICPILLLHFELDESANDEIKFAIKTGVDVSALLLGGYFLSTTEGTLFYLNLLSVGSATLNTATNVFREELEGIIDPATIDKIQMTATIIELGANGIGIIKSSPEVLAILKPKAQDVLNYIDANPSKFVDLTSAAKLGLLESIEGSKDLLDLSKTSNMISGLSSAPLKNLLNEIDVNLKFANRSNTEISIFSRHNGTVTEVATVAKVNGTDVLKIVDERILQKVGADAPKLAQDIVDQPKLLKAIGDEPQLAKAWKKLDDAGVDDVIRKNPAALAKTNRYLDNGLSIEAGGVVKQSDGTVLGKLDNKDVYNPGELKVKGEYSGRHFDPDDAGGPIVRKNWTNPTIDQTGIDDITKHLSRFEDVDGDNAFMIDRLKKIKNGETPATDYDKRFYTHELEEYKRYKSKGIADGVNDEDFYYNAHTASLETYSINEIDSPLYHPR